MNIVYTITNIDDEYGHNDLIGVFSSEEDAIAWWDKNKPYEDSVLYSREEINVYYMGYLLESHKLNQPTIILRR